MDRDLVQIAFLIRCLHTKDNYLAQRYVQACIQEPAELVENARVMDPSDLCRDHERSGC